MDGTLERIRNKQIHAWIRFCTEHTVAVVPPQFMDLSADPAQGDSVQFDPGLDIIDALDPNKKLSRFLIHRLRDLSVEAARNPEFAPLRSIDFLLSLTLASSAMLMSIDGTMKYSKEDFDASSAISMEFAKKFKEISERGVSPTIILNGLLKALCSLLYGLKKFLDQEFRGTIETKCANKDKENK